MPLAARRQQQLAAAAPAGSSWQQQRQQQRQQQQRWQPDTPPCPLALPAHLLAAALTTALPPPCRSPAQVSRQFNKPGGDKGSAGYVRSLAFDPEGVYVAAVQVGGVEGV